jgi:hypothetical protein
MLPTFLMLFRANLNESLVRTKEINNMKNKTFEENEHLFTNQTNRQNDQNLIKLARIREKNVSKNNH